MAAERYQGYANSATWNAALYLSNERVPYEKITSAIIDGAAFDGASFQKLVKNVAGLQVTINRSESDDERYGSGIKGGQLRLDSWVEGEIDWAEIGNEFATNFIDQRIAKLAEKCGVTVDQDQVESVFVSKEKPLDGVFSGPILAVDEQAGVVLMSKGCGEARAFPAAALSRIPDVGEKTRVVFKDGKGAVDAPAIENAVDRGR